MKYPIGIQDFKNIITDGFVYVDKTDLIYRIVTEGQIYFLSRPRRFGKSLLVSTLKYYFQGEHELFKGLAIDSLEKEWKTYPIFHIDFNSTNFQSGQALKKCLDAMVEEWEEQYGFEGNPNYDSGRRFAKLLAFIHESTGKRCVVLIDEYDKPLLDVLGTDSKTKDENGKEILVEEFNRNILKAFYSSFKAASADLRFVFLTGVTKFSQVSVFSGFNQPIDLSLDSRYDTLCGITETELEKVFHAEVDSMADDLGLSHNEIRRVLKLQYDGYHFSRRMVDVYNPFSMFNALCRKEISNYWFATGTPTYLIRLLGHTHENLNELTGKYYRSADFVDYRADIERPLPMIYQSGYLTIKGYDSRFNLFLLDFPNNEVKEGFVSLVANNYFKTDRDSAVEVITWVKSLENGDLEMFRRQLTAFFSSIPYTMRRKGDEREHERYFHYTFYLLFRIMSTYTILTEQQQSEGRADCIIETPENIYIFEFKLDGTAEDALMQIESKGYSRPYMADSRPIHEIGVSFSSETGTIGEWKEA